MSQGPRILMTPHFRGNPYQDLLANALTEQGCEVYLANGHRHRFPLSQSVLDCGAQLLHLHWMHPFCDGESVVSRCKNALRYAMDLERLRMLEVPLLWTVHNVMSHESHYPAIELWLRRRIAHRAHALIVHDTHTKDVVAKKYRIAPERIQVIPHGSYQGLYGDPIPRQEARAALGLPPEGRLFLHLGMLRPYKGTLDLVEVWPENHRMRPKDHLLIAGEPYDRAYAQAVQQRCEQTPGATFRSGYVPDEQIAYYFSAADIVVLPFRQITTSGSLILALSFAKPIIAPRIESLTDALNGMNDLLYDEISKTALLEALKRSMDVDLDAISASASSVECSWEEVASAMCRAYPFAPKKAEDEPEKTLAPVGPEEV